MYNGIGVRTVRGTATSGHVQKNASYVKPEFYRNNIESNRRDGGVGDTNDSFNPSTFSNTVKVNAEVMEHNRKRKIEGQVYVYKDELESEGRYNDEEISNMLQAYRDKLSKKSEIHHDRLSGRGGERDRRDRDRRNGYREHGREKRDERDRLGGDRRGNRDASKDSNYKYSGTDAHAQGDMKQRENDRFRSAFRLHNRSQEEESNKYELQRRGGPTEKKKDGGGVVEKDEEERQSFLARRPRVEKRDKKQEAEDAKIIAAMNSRSKEFEDGEEREIAEKGGVEFVSASVAEVQDAPKKSKSKSSKRKKEDRKSKSKSDSKSKKRRRRSNSTSSSSSSSSSDSSSSSSSSGSSSSSSSSSSESSTEKRKKKKSKKGKDKTDEKTEIEPEKEQEKKQEEEPQKARVKCSRWED